MLTSQNENTFLVKIILQRGYNDIVFDVNTIDFTEPSAYDVEDINTFEQLIYFFAELFGEDLYGYLEQKLYDLVEDIELDFVEEVQIINVSENVTYYINLDKHTIDIER